MPKERKERKEKIRKEIEQKRLCMVKLAAEKGFGDPEVLQLSRELDALIVAFQQILDD